MKKKKENRIKRIEKKLWDSKERANIEVLEV
jgi:hypothetical protein